MKAKVIFLWFGHKRNITKCDERDEKHGQLHFCLSLVAQLPFYVVYRILFESKSSKDRFEI